MPARRSFWVPRVPTAWSGGRIDASELGDVPAECVGLPLTVLIEKQPVPMVGAAEVGVGGAPAPIGSGTRLRRRRNTKNAKAF